MIVGMCGFIEIYSKMLVGQCKEGESFDVYEWWMVDVVSIMFDGQNICMYFELVGCDLGWCMVFGCNLKVDGIDFDGLGLVGGKCCVVDICVYENFEGMYGE